MTLSVASPNVAMPGLEPSSAPLSLSCLPSAWAQMPHPSWGKASGLAPFYRWETEAQRVAGLVTWYRVRNSAFQTLTSYQGSPTWTPISPRPSLALSGLLPSPGMPQYNKARREKRGNSGCLFLGGV